MEKLNKIYSPLTQNSNISLIRKIKSNTIISLYKKYNIDVSSYYDGIKEVLVYQCNTTGYIFYYPFSLSGDSYFYEHFQNFEWYYMPWKWEHDIAKMYLSDNISVLEVGCAHGSFLERINNDYKLSKSIGLELNKTTKNNSKKWKIINKSIQDFSVDNVEQFDLVCSFQVLEHISNVHSFIESNISCLKEGGKLIISVPNNNSFIKNLESPLNMPPHHMGIWTEESLVALTTIFSINLVNIHYEYLKDYHIDSYISAEHYSNGSKLLNKVLKKIDFFTGRYKRLQSKIFSEKESLIGHTILVVFEKRVS